ncbi:hypothetical protein [Clostridium sp. D53t1_180928_C8]|uniref:hypothetical protein n=1 Tax=Clostridium sp. D53t1_180928_C8 TaxID=2787101 RepID=UPI0018AB2AFC|nr:hypothetical protein [Clostridium sp. D53t1_180928_C8]
MRNKKNWIKAFILSVVIVVVYVVLFEMLGADQEQIGIVVATIIVFTMLLCTYSIIDEIRKFKHNNE